MSLHVSKLVVAAAIVAIAAPAPILAADRLAATVSVMTYNVHGLPWPVAEDRSASLSAIAMQLRTMRSEGRQPGIVALQEAFVPDAKAIGAEAGYRYVAFGAPADDAATASTVDDRRFVSAGSMLHGERVGKHVGSGLAIFSDYPILTVRRISYPVCAGYDCLANKGAMAALIAVPGVSRPVMVVDTHLNSNGATGVSEPRALYAYKRQIDSLSGFVSSLSSSGSTMLVAGDFNVGKDAQRRAYFAQHMFGGSLALTAGGAQCLASSTCRVTQKADVAVSTSRAKDWLMYRSAARSSTRPLTLGAPFGHDAANAMLSDHVGVMIRYELDRSTARDLKWRTRLADAGVPGRS